MGSREQDRLCNGPSHGPDHCKLTLDLDLLLGLPPITVVFRSRGERQIGKWVLGSPSKGRCGPRGSRQDESRGPLAVQL